MKGGIPQGSALGPLLFLVHMNTLLSTISHTDNTALICSGSTPTQVAAMLNHQLKLINTWLVDNQMQLNICKSWVMWFCPRLLKISSFIT